MFSNPRIEIKILSIIKGCTGNEYLLYKWKIYDNREKS